jgi:hypothetical protein
LRIFQNERRRFVNAYFQPRRARFGYSRMLFINPRPSGAGKFPVSRSGEAWFEKCHFEEGEPTPDVISPPHVSAFAPTCVISKERSD